MRRRPRLLYQLYMILLFPLCLLHLKVKKYGSNPSTIIPPSWLRMYLIQIRRANINQQASPSGSPTQSEVKSVQTVTAGGSTVIQVVTIQQTPTVTGTMAPGNLPTQQKDSGGISGGLIAAAVVASVLGVALIAALVWFFLRKRRQNEESNEKYGDINDDPSSPSNLNRNISTHSKAGLLERGYPPTVATRMSRVSSTNGPEMSSSDAVSPVTPNSERRHSNMIVYDSRLNPNALMVIDKGSHTSLNTLDDHRDYGRMLKVSFQPRHARHASTNKCTRSRIQIRIDRACLEGEVSNSPVQTKIEICLTF